MTFIRFIFLSFDAYGVRGIGSEIKSSNLILLHSPRTLLLRTGVKPQRFENLSTRTFVHYKI